VDQVIQGGCLGLDQQDNPPAILSTVFPALPPTSLTDRRSPSLTVAGMDLDWTGLDFGGESSPTRKFRLELQELQSSPVT
jgi:hypothetical protein